MKDNAELLPCPFCGSDDIEAIKTDEYYEEYEVQCQECGGRGAWENTKTMAIKVWNRRVQ